ncbi:Lysozyme family protein [Bradyrhizobium erythrophlei]|uniref:Lysozyme family protein n=2 Tax=Bradyrhizobium erythrophlei TaxID=1437360 RepID=A0A1M5TAG7_9BRAD|nr:Lysozyme family protein [Bradyrhizobium erythrophlei]
MFPKYNNWWGQLKVVAQSPANLAAAKIHAGTARYQAVEAKTTVPWYVIGLLHMRESNNNFHCWLHNGDPMFNHEGQPTRTVQVPPNRPPNPAVTWEEGAVDALQGFKLTQIKDWSAERIAYTAEAFNGWGYTLYRHIPSPYLFGGSSIQQRGKYVRDRVWDSTEWDTQLGVLTTLKALMLIDPSIDLHPSMTVTRPDLPPIAPYPTPKADHPSLPTLAPKPSIWVVILTAILSILRKK